LAGVLVSNLVAASFIHKSGVDNDMNTINEQKPAVWFWIVSVLALVWNLLGVMAYLGQVTISPEDLAKMPEAEQAMIAALPAWYIGAFAIAVFAGALGCLLLLLRRRLALWTLVLSLVAVVTQQIYTFLLSDIGGSLDSASLGMTVSIPVVAVLLIWLAQSSSKNGWLK